MILQRQRQKVPVSDRYWAVPAQRGFTYRRSQQQIIPLFDPLLKICVPPFGHLLGSFLKTFVRSLKVHWVRASLLDLLTLSSMPIQPSMTSLIAFWEVLHRWWWWLHQGRRSSWSLIQKSLNCSYCFFFRPRLVRCASCFSFSSFAVSVFHHILESDCSLCLHIGVHQLRVVCLVFWDRAYKCLAN